MKKLAILGASGHGKVVAEIAELSGWNEVVFFDDAFPEVTSNAVWPVMGNTNSLISTLSEFDGIIVAIGNNEIRLDKVSLLESMQGRLVSLYHPTAVISQYAQIESGSVVMAKAVVNPFARIGKACILNTGSVIDHDCQLYDAVHVCPGTNLAGDVSVGEKSWIGIGASVRQCVSIGKNVTVGAGAVVISNLPDNVVAVGVPAFIKEN